MEYREARSAIEAVVFASPHPVSAKDLGEILGIDPRSAHVILDDLRREYDRDGRGMQIVFVAGGYQMATRPEHARYIAGLNVGARPRLSRPALETVAMIAYRQPITKAEIERLRGVKVDAVLATLMERGLVRAVGRKKSAGRPVLYGTTPEFLRWFGLASLEELPPLDDAGGSPSGVGLLRSPPGRLGASSRGDTGRRMRGE